MSVYDYLNILFKESQFIKNANDKMPNLGDFLELCELDNKFHYVLFNIPSFLNNHIIINNIFKWFCLKEDSGHILNLLANDSKFKIDDDSMNLYHPTNYLTIFKIKTHRIETEYYFNDFSKWYEGPIDNECNLFN